MNGKTIAAVVGGVAALAGIGGGIWYYMKNGKDKPKEKKVDEASSSKQ